jgi:hypothetical protein
VPYVPSLKRNLISVFSLDTSGYITEFGNIKCIIKFYYIQIFIAPLVDKLYMISPDSVMNVCDKSNKCKYNNETSPKLWHCRLSHILKGEMERLFKEEILQPLDFLEPEHCTGLLEIIHTDICGPFPII